MKVITELRIETKKGTEFTLIKKDGRVRFQTPKGLAYYTGAIEMESGSTLKFVEEGTAKELKVGVDADYSMLEMLQRSASKDCDFAVLDESEEASYEDGFGDIFKYKGLRVAYKYK